MVKVISLLERTKQDITGASFRLEDASCIEAIAREHRFYGRKRKKITASGFVRGFINSMKSGKRSLRNLSIEIGLSCGEVLHKTSLEDRFNGRTLSMVEEILRRVVNTKVLGVLNRLGDKKTKGLLKDFKNVLIGDSTCEKLGANLSAVFPGAFSSTGSAATLRIQAVYNYTTSCFVQFGIGSFRDNDQGSTDLVLEVAKKGDLVIRDLGYFVLAVLLQMIKRGVYFISRLSYGTNIYDAESGEEIDLQKFIKGKTFIDQRILLGKAKIPIRLAGHKLPLEVAKKRREKAKKDRCVNTNHSEAYYALLSWSFYVTNVEEEKLNVEGIIRIYKIRWYIEIVFKSWKSHFNLKKMLGKEQMSYYRALISVYLILIQITYWSMGVFQYIKQGVAKITDRQISVLKYMDMINSMTDILLNIKHIEELSPYIKHFAAHATYEKRRRDNILQLLI